MCKYKKNEQMEKKKALHTESLDSNVASDM